MTRIVSSDWMPDVKMRRIHLHWTAGAYKANATDKKAYHILVEGDGDLVRGNNSIRANAKPLSSPYAAHTKNANTGAIGVSLCCMRNAVESPFDAGPSPMTKVQWDRGIEVIADLAEFYSIPVSPTTILTHAEVEPNLLIDQNNKWDIVRLAFDDSFKGRKAVGDELRRRVAALIDDPTPEQGDEEMDDELMLPRYRVSGVAPGKLNFRKTPNGDRVGALPEGVEVERMGVDGVWWQVRTPLGYVGYVHSSYLTPVVEY